MSDSGRHLLQALYDSLLVSVGVGRDAPYFVACLPGIHLARADFAEPVTLRNPRGSLPALEAFSLQVDQAPLLGRFFQPGITHSEFMQEVCSATLAWDGGASADFGPPCLESTLPDERALSLAEQPAGDEEAGLAFEQLEQAARAENRRASERLEAWRAGAPPDAAPAHAPRSRRGLLESSAGMSFEALSASLAHAPQVPSFGSYGDPLTAARRALTQWEQQSRLSSGRFLPTYAFPSDWMNETVEELDPSFLEFTAGSRKLEASPFSSALAGVHDDFARLGARTGALPLQTRPEDMKISMKLLRVQLFRPWFRASLLSLHGLRLPGRPVGCFSKGEADPIDAHKLIFPLWTTAALIVKDCVVEAPWSTQDRARLAAGEGPVRFGPVAARAQLEGDKLRFKGMSLVGYLCRLVPRFPLTA